MSLGFALVGLLPSKTSNPNDTQTTSFFAAVFGSSQVQSCSFLFAFVRSFFLVEESLKTRLSVYLGSNLKPYNTVRKTSGLDSCR